MEFPYILYVWLEWKHEQPAVLLFFLVEHSIVWWIFKHLLGAMKMGDLFVYKTIQNPIFDRLVIPA